MRNGTAGGTRCWTCSGGFVGVRQRAGARSAAVRLPLTEAGLAALRHVLYGGPQAAVQLYAGAGRLQALDQAGEAFIAAQLERGFRTLDYYKALLG